MTQANLKTRKQKNKMFSVDAQWQPSTVDEEARPVEVVFTTGADVHRARMFGESYIERLEVSDEAIDLTRLKAGAPLLDSHGSYALRQTLGVVEDAWISEGRGHARVRFSRRDEVEPVFRDVVDGITRKVSVGYKREDVVELKERGPKNEAIHVVKRWTPHEISFVTVPADNGAEVRSYSEQRNEEKMEAETRAAETAETPATPVQTVTRAQAETPTVDPQLEQRAASNAKTEERERVSSILEACEKVDLPSTFARSLIDSDMPLLEARAKIINELADREPEHTSSIVEPGDGKREAEYTETVVNALLHRSGIETTTDSDALSLSSRTLPQIAERAAEMDGISVRSLPTHELIKRAMTSSTLADVIALTAGRSLVKGYELEPRTFVPVFRKTTALNFRDISRVKLSDAPELALVAEGADYTEGTLSDEKETYAVAKYGKLLPVTWELIINDDLNAISRLPQLLGASAARRESDVVWGVLTANGAMTDTHTIFDAANHGNAGTAALAAPALEAARAAMRDQTAENGSIISIEPKFLVVGTALEATAEKLLSVPSDVSSASTQVTLAERFRNSIQLIVEPRITGTNWYLISDSNRIDTIEYAHLAGHEGVSIERIEEEKKDVITLKARDVIGAGAIDFRGMYHSTGAV